MKSSTTPQAEQPKKRPNFVTAYLDNLDKERALATISTPLSKDTKNTLYLRLQSLSNLPNLLE